MCIRDRYTFEQDGGGFSYVRTPATGPELVEGYFRKPSYANPNLSFNQDRITDEVWITRGERQPLYNAFNEGGYSENNSPSGTQWSMGPTSSHNSLSDYSDFKNATGENLQNIPGQTMSLNITGTNLFYDVEFLSWSRNEGGGFSYRRILVESDIPIPGGNNSLSFDGNENFVDFGEGSDQYDLENYTISTWVKLNQTKSYAGIFGKGTGGGEANYSFLLWFPEISWGEEGSHQKIFFSLNGITSGSLDDRHIFDNAFDMPIDCLLYTSPSPRDRTRSRMPSSA